MTRKKEINSPARNCWLTTADGFPWLLAPHRLKSSCNKNVRNLGFISVLRNQIGSYTKLNCWVAPSPMHLSRVVLDLAEGDILLLCSRPCSFAYQIGKALMV